MVFFSEDIEYQIFTKTGCRRNKKFILPNLVRNVESNVIQAKNLVEFLQY